MKHKKKKHNLPKPTSMRLKDNHTWKAPKGYKIVVLDRGAVSFNVPEKWEVGKLEPFEMHDVAPPKDNVRLGVTFWRTPPGVDWTGLPLAKLLADSTEGSELEILARGEIARHSRTDLEIVWMENRFLDPIEKREAFSRIALARGWDVHVLITLDYWVDESEKHRPAWHEVINSLQLGRYIEDPTKGIVTH